MDAAILPASHPVSQTRAALVLDLSLTDSELVVIALFSENRYARCANATLRVRIML